ncbi:MAG: pyridoxamine 5'-phosphate oxidase family protein [Bacteroidota bacterium]
MGKRYTEISTKLSEFIADQKLFFVATAAAEGRVNVSPKGMDTLRVLGPNKVIWLNLTGSGNETAAHLMENNRMTIMFCAFEGNPMILRLYGSATIFHHGESEFNEYISSFPEQVGSRQIIELDVELVQTSCGFGVPMMDFNEERTLLTAWGTKKGEDGIKKYWEEKNRVSLDNKEIK